MVLCLYGKNNVRNVFLGEKKLLLRGVGGIALTKTQWIIMIVKKSVGFVLRLLDDGIRAKI